MLEVQGFNLELLCGHSLSHATILASPQIEDIVYKDFNHPAMMCLRSLVLLQVSTNKWSYSDISTSFSVYESDPPKPTE
jgi:hypothetical protein